MGNSDERKEDKERCDIRRNIERKKVENKHEKEVICFYSYLDFKKKKKLN